MKHLKATHIARALRKTAQLRALTLSLQRAKHSPKRERLLEEFEGFLSRLQTAVPTHEPVSLPAVDVLVTGIKACWARGDYATIKQIAGVLPQELLNQHMLLSAYVTEVSLADERQAAQQIPH